MFMSIINWLFSYVFRVSGSISFNVCVQLYVLIGLNLCYDVNLYRENRFKVLIVCIGVREDKIVSGGWWW